MDSNRWNDGRPHEANSILLFEDAEATEGVSLNGNRNGLFNGAPVVGTVGEFSIGLHHHDKRLFEIFFGFREGPALGVHAGDFFHVPQVPFTALHVHSRELTNHAWTIPCESGPVKFRGNRPSA